MYERMKGEGLASLSLLMSLSLTESLPLDWGCDWRCYELVWRLLWNVALVRDKVISKSLLRGLEIRLNLFMVNP